MYQTCIVSAYLVFDDLDLFFNVKVLYAGYLLNQMMFCSKHIIENIMKYKCILCLFRASIHKTVLSY